MKNKRFFGIILGIAGVSALISVLLLVDQSRTFLSALLIRVFLFAKHHIVAILSAFFLVKGKFILTLFLKKIALLSATGLGKRYFIEKVLTHHIKIHFLDHIRDDVTRLIAYVKKNFKNFPIVKQLIAIVAFLSSLGFVGKFMGWMIAIKVFVAKFWSFLLAIFLKAGTTVVYFFTDYIWGSWIAPIVEVVIFTWLLQWMEKIPFLKKFFQKLYRLFTSVFVRFEEYMQRVFHIPIKQFFAYLARIVKHWIGEFMNVKRVSAWEYLQEIRTLKPSLYQQVKHRRQERRARLIKDKNYLPAYLKVWEKRRKRLEDSAQ